MSPFHALTCDLLLLLLTNTRGSLSLHLVVVSLKAA